MDVCEGCGFDFDAVERSLLEGRSQAAVAAIGELLQTASDRQIERRPSPHRWSALEYAFHVRDVLLTLRERMVTGLIEDNPGFPSMHREERLERDLYRLDTASDIAAELAACRNMLFRLFAAIDDEQANRIVQYGSPNPTPRSIGWMARQAVHESEHHLADMHENLVLLAN